MHKHNSSLLNLTLMEKIIYWHFTICNNCNKKIHIFSVLDCKNVTLLPDILKKTSHKAFTLKIKSFVKKAYFNTFRLIKIKGCH